MNASTNKMDSAEVYNLFETIKELVAKQAEKLTEQTKSDTTVFETRTEHHYHRHTIDIDIRSNWFFFSWIALVVVIFGLFWVIANQQQTISQYKENDLKYRYIKMQGQTNEESIHCLEQQFKYSDSIKIVCKQVERYEELVKERAERMERAKRDKKKAEMLEKEVEFLKKGK